MKRILLANLFCLVSVLAFSQHTPQKATAQTIAFDPTIIDNAMTAQKNANASLVFSPDFIFNGTIVANDARYGNMQVMIVRSTEDSKMLLQVSKTINDDKSTVYAGRILHPGGDQAFEIKNNSGNYYLQKINMQRIIEPCNL